MPGEVFDGSRIKCAVCGDVDWSPALGSGRLKLSGIIVGQYDDHGQASMQPGIELAAFTCQGCGYVRLHDPTFIGKHV